MPTVTLRRRVETNLHNEDEAGKEQTRTRDDAIARDLELKREKLEKLEATIKQREEENILASKEMEARFKAAEAGLKAREQKVGGLAETEASPKDREVMLAAREADLLAAEIKRKAAEEKEKIEKEEKEQKEKEEKEQKEKEVKR